MLQKNVINDREQSAEPKQTANEVVKSQKMRVRSKWKPRVTPSFKLSFLYLKFSLCCGSDEIFTERERKRSMLSGNLKNKTKILSLLYSPPMPLSRNFVSAHSIFGSRFSFSVSFSPFFVPEFSFWAKILQSVFSLFDIPAVCAPFCRRHRLSFFPFDWNNRLSTLHFINFLRILTSFACSLTTCASANFPPPSLSRVRHLIEDANAGKNWLFLFVLFTHSWLYKSVTSPFPLLVRLCHYDCAVEKRKRWKA